MYYYFKNKKLFKFNNDLIIMEDTDVEGEFCLDENGYSLLKVLNEKPVLQGNTLQVGKTKIVTYDKKLPDYDNEVKWSVEVNLNMLSKASKFVAKNSGRPILTGVNINDTGSIVATDSFKMFIYNFKQSENKVTLSPDFVNELSKYSDNAIIYINGNYAFTEIKGVTIVGRILLGNYPDISKLLNIGGSEYSIPDNLTSLIDAASIVENNIIVFENKELKIVSETIEFCEDVDLDINIALNLENLKLVLKTVPKSVLIYNSWDTPLYFRENNMICIILPCSK